MHPALVRLRRAKPLVRCRMQHDTVTTTVLVDASLLGRNSGGGVNATLRINGTLQWPRKGDAVDQGSAMPKAALPHHGSN